MNVNDILFVQEIILSISNIDFVDKISDKFDNVVIPSIAIDGEPGRPRGGLVIFFKKYLKNFVKPAIFSEHFLGIILSSNNNKILLINAYLPCDNRTNEALVKYRNALAELENFIDFENVNRVVVVGDFNCDKMKGRFFRELESFITNKSFILADSILPINSYTYIGSYDTTSWIDHIIVSQPDMVRNIEIQYGITVSDHIPLNFELIIEDNPFGNKDQLPNKSTEKIICWNKLSEWDKQMYGQKINDSLLNYYNVSLQCRDKFCDSVSHTNLLNDAYNYLVESVKSSSANLISCCTTNRFKAVPGWSERVKSFHNIAREKYLIWNREGRMRLGLTYDRMKESRSNFKKALKDCRRNEDIIKKEKLCNSFKIKDKEKFWRDVKNLKNNANKNAPNIDGEVDPLKATEIFSNKYKGILNDPQSTTIPDNFNFIKEQIKEQCQDKQGFIRISPFQVEMAINKMNNCVDHIDGIHAEHLKVGCKNGRVLTDFISRLFTSFLSHGFVPMKMIEGEIRPTIKNRFGNLSSSDNYRPVMNSSNLLKVFEYCILNKLNIELNTRQFGFRKGTSTTMAVTALTETVKKYIKKQSKIYATFLDLSKAFDKVNHNILICKMQDKGISPFVINTLDFMYRNQKVDISFNNEKSESWLITNGVRQGAVLSPILFSLYIDDLINEISNMNVGCKISMYRLNIIAYADDLVLLAPTSDGLQHMVDKLSQLLSDLCLQINKDKTVCMRFEQKSRIYSPFSIIKINGTSLTFVDEYNYLGIIVNKNLCNDGDIEKCSKSFLRQFWSIYRRFSFADMNVIAFLFESHCTSFYGSQLWHSDSSSKKELNALAVSYHKCIKIMLNLPWCTGNHEVCESLGFLTFKHLINKHAIKFLFSLERNLSPCLLPIKSFVLQDSSLCKNVREIFRVTYGIKNILSNDIDAIEARINFVQRHEDRYISNNL
jgi:hypothetical protein